VLASLRFTTLRVGHVVVKGSLYRNYILLIVVHYTVWKLRFGVSCNGHVGTNFVKIGEGFRTSYGHTQTAWQSIKFVFFPFYETQ